MAETCGERAEVNCVVLDHKFDGQNTTTRSGGSDVAGRSSLPRRIHMGSGTILRESGGRAGSDLATRNKQNASTHGT
jgi:hypothetical protein